MSFALFLLLFLAMKSNTIYTFNLAFHDTQVQQLVGFTRERCTYIGIYVLSTRLSNPVVSKRGSWVSVVTWEHLGNADSGAP